MDIFKSLKEDNSNFYISTWKELERELRRKNKMSIFDDLLYKWECHYKRDASDDEYKKLACMVLNDINEIQFS